MRQLRHGHTFEITGPELLGVGRTGRRHFPPDVLQTRLEGGVGHVHNGCTQLISMDISSASGKQFLVALSMVSLADRLDANIGSHAIQTEQ